MKAGRLLQRKMASLRCEAADILRGLLASFALFLVAIHVPNSKEGQREGEGQHT